MPAPVGGAPDHLVPLRLPAQGEVRSIGRSAAASTLHRLPARAL
jgi:hypothetical protein